MNTLEQTVARLRIAVEEASTLAPLAARVEHLRIPLRDVLLQGVAVDLVGMVRPMAGDEELWDAVWALWCVLPCRDELESRAQAALSRSMATIVPRLPPPPPQDTRAFISQFDLEVESWVHGLWKFPGEVFPGLVQNVLKEMLVLWHVAVERSCPFPIARISRRMAQALGQLVSEEEVILGLCALLPHPWYVAALPRITLALIVEQAAERSPGLALRMRESWANSAHRITSPFTEAPLPTLPAATQEAA